MAVINPLGQFVDKVNQYSTWLSSKLLTWVFRCKVRLADTTGIEVLHTDGKTATCF
jgi:hypothetical protein